MAYEIKDFTITIPAGTAKSAGFTSSMAFDPRIVTQINVRVPPGPRGEVGFKIGSGGLQILPAAPGDYIVTDNEDLQYPLDDTITSGAWQLLGYNTGVYDHTLRVYFFCDLIPITPAASSGSGSVVGTSGSTGDTGSGTGDGSGSGGSVPPVTIPNPPSPPIVTPPGGTGTPVLLPPTINIPPSLGGPVLPPTPETILIGVADLTEVWLLDEEGYHQIPDQDTVTALTSAGVQGVAVSSATHQSLIAAGRSAPSVDIGPEILAGWWQAIKRGGVPPRRV
jgi:hypothetical protein